MTHPSMPPLTPAYPLLLALSSAEHDSGSPTTSSSIDWGFAPAVPLGHLDVVEMEFRIAKAVANEAFTNGYYIPDSVDGGQSSRRFRAHHLAAAYLQSRVWFLSHRFGHAPPLQYTLPDGVTVILYEHPF